jgi:hypothetical protein
MTALPRVCAAAAVTSQNCSTTAVPYRSVVMAAYQPPAVAVSERVTSPDTRPAGAGWSVRLRSSAAVCARAAVG